MAWSKPVWGDVDFGNLPDGLIMFPHTTPGEVTAATAWFAFAGVNTVFRLDLGQRGQPVTVVGWVTFQDLVSVQDWLKTLEQHRIDGTTAALTALERTRANVSIVAVLAQGFQAVRGSNGETGRVHVAVTFQDHDLT